MAGLPELTYRYPGIKDTSISLNPTILIDWSTDLDTTQWSDPVQLQSIFLLINNTTNQEIPVSYVGYTANIRRISLTPSSGLVAGTEYKAIVKKGVRDSYGRRSANEYVWNFVTQTVSVGTPTLQSPGNNTIQASFPQFSWSTVASASGTVFYLFQLDDVPNFSTPLISAGGLTSTTYTPGASLPDGNTYYWRVRAYSGSVTGSWSSIYGFYFGLTSNIHPTSQTEFTPARDFVISSVGFKNGLSNTLNYPTISFTFSTVPASTFAQNITITKKSQLPRNDTDSSYYETSLAGTWTGSGTVTLTFTPSESITSNTRYTVTLFDTLVDVSGNSLGLETTYYFTSRYDPYYSDIRAVKARLRSEALTMPDDLINYHIYMASLEAKARYWGYLSGAAISSFDSLTETTVRDSTNLKSHGVLKWVVAKATYNILVSTLIDDLRNVGRSRRLGDFSETLTRDFTDAIKKLLDLISAELDELEDLLVPSDVPITVTPHDLWSPWFYDSDWSIKDIEGKRDDHLSW
jgi:hypothetical protein